MKKKAKRGAPAARRAKAVNPPKPPPGPVIFFTRNGVIIGKAVAPRGANDVRIIWGIPVLGAAGWWTKNGQPMPKGQIVVPPGTNDFHFSLTGAKPKGPGIVPPVWANDFELVWDRDRITEAWWTRDGKRMEPITQGAGTQGFNCALDLARHPHGFPVALSLAGVLLPGPLFLSREVYAALAAQVYDEEPEGCHLEILKSNDGGYTLKCVGACPDEKECGKYFIDTPDKDGRYVMRMVCECH
ncbi:MAG TPA: hypothetical protein VMI53_06780 [Opitutaceae bacterium]|nr:hypothetical protein [Opitutaceae bacterium]